MNSQDNILNHPDTNDLCLEYEDKINELNKEVARLKLEASRSRLGLPPSRPGGQTWTAADLEMLEIYYREPSLHRHNSL